MNTKPRELVKIEFREMLRSGKLPCMEFKISNHASDFLVVDIDCDAYGIRFELSEDLKTHFDGCIQKRHYGFYITHAEIDRSDYTLDNVLQLIHCNVLDGVIIPNNLVEG